MKIAITGATGQLGSIVVEQLKNRVSADHIVALARNTEKASALGVEVREFDYSKPEILTGALQGIDRLLLISGSELGRRAVQHINVINAAKEAGVTWIVYTSLLHLETSSLNLAGEHLATEKALKESGIDYTLLRNGWYSENYTASIPGAMGGGAFLGSAGDGKIASAPRADYAEAAAIVITDEDNKGKTFELAGDTYYTLSDLAGIISEQSGKTIPYNNIPEDEYANILKNIGLPDGLALGLASWDVSASKDDLFDDSHELSKILGRPTTPIVESVKMALDLASV
ncbi:SDR family oxidoreductase [Maribacter polysiphoniae]|uniref:NAD(P)H dehydrogenase (Quinone) n=1 Tax=Maribacter polysiphoniae TaxID=429344 RepID=A0A316E5Q2_9FLAO|nr:SDR family oxidoreductase [Maribacter polysiphoniae]MBD1259292.1 SDR family oxidoreductase [Maribacter polysiphoniae]PWK24852.1 NAD(P)H dehydrogenase (quinone) [Maribacter polysiphoniae]